MSDENNTQLMLLQKLVEKTDKQTESLARIEANQEATKAIVDDLVPRVKAVEDTTNRWKWTAGGAFGLAGMAHAPSVWAFVKTIFLGH